MAGGEHAKHRERMRTRFLEHGLDNFADHEVLELLLFYAVPRGDVSTGCSMSSARWQMYWKRKHRICVG